MEDECTEDKDEGKDEPEVKKKKDGAANKQKNMWCVCVEGRWGSGC